MSGDLSSPGATIRHGEEMAAFRLAALVESSTDAIIGKDLDGIITDWNRGAERIFGHTAAEIIGTSGRRLIPADRPEEESVLLEKIRRGVNAVSFEALRQTRDGRTVHVT